MMKSESDNYMQKHKEVKLFPYLDFFPKLHPTVFVASGCKIIGSVEIGANSSVWYNTVVRGDVNYVKIGENTNIQDGSILHVTNGKYPLIIGNNITIGHRANIHGSVLKDLSFIGMGSTILDGAVIEEKTMVAAGALVKQGFIVPSGKLVAGVPAKIIRDLTDEEIQLLERSAQQYVEYSRITIESLSKNNYQIDW